MRQNRGRLTITFLVALALLGGGCASTELAPLSGDGGYTGNSNDDVHPNPNDPGVVPGPDGRPLLVAGRYELTSIVDLAGAGAFGDTISGTLVQLSMFHDNPAGTILELMALYQVPYYTQVWNILPGFIKDKIESWLDDYLFAALFEAIPALDQAVQVVDDVA